MEYSDLSVIHRSFNVYAIIEYHNNYNIIHYEETAITQNAVVAFFTYVFLAKMHGQKTGIKLLPQQRLFNTV